MVWSVMLRPLEYRTLLSRNERMTALTVPRLKQMKQAAEPICMLTAYDATQAHTVEAGGVDAVLVGDSLGMVVQGADSTLPVTIDQMVYHSRCVAAGLKRALLITDLPMLSEATVDRAAESARQVMAAGAQMVKIEGAGPMLEIVEFLSSRGVPVCGHLGLTPQWVHRFGGYKVQGQQDDAARYIRDSARALVEAGIDLLVLECVPTSLAAQITGDIAVPTIGIGAGPDTDGQVLVLYDMLGMGEGPRPRFVKNFMQAADSPQQAVASYCEAVRSGQYPGPEHQYG